MPNVVAGILIGIGNTSWATVAGASAIWGAVWIVWSLIRKSPWVMANIQRGVMDKEWSAARTWVSALSIEYVTAVLTALPIGCIVFLIKGWVS